MVIVDDYVLCNNVGDCFEPECNGFDIECSQIGDCPDDCSEDD